MLLLEVTRKLPEMPEKKVNHALHIVLSIITLGFWLPVYALILIAKSWRNRQKYVEQRDRAEGRPPGRPKGMRIGDLPM